MDAVPCPGVMCQLGPAFIAMPRAHLDLFWGCCASIWESTSRVWLCGVGAAQVQWEVSAKGRRDSVNVSACAKSSLLGHHP